MVVTRVCLLNLTRKTELGHVVTGSIRLQRDERVFELLLENSIPWLVIIQDAQSDPRAARFAV